MCNAFDDGTPLPENEMCNLRWLLAQLAKYDSEVNASVQRLALVRGGMHTVHILGPILNDREYVGCCESFAKQIQTHVAEMRNYLAKITTTLKLITERSNPRDKDAGQNFSSN